MIEKKLQIDFFCLFNDTRVGNMLTGEEKSFLIFCKIFVVVVVWEIETIQVFLSSFTNVSCLGKPTLWAITLKIVNIRQTRISEIRISRKVIIDIIQNNVV